MIELKISQGAKPGKGGILPAEKVTAEIAITRGIPMGQNCISPARHRAFSTPIELMQFIGDLRRLARGKPVGFKLRSEEHTSELQSLMRISAAVFCLKKKTQTTSTTR